MKIKILDIHNDDAYHIYKQFLVGREGIATEIVEWTPDKTSCPDYIGWTACEVAFDPPVIVRAEADIDQAAFLAIKFMEYPLVDEELFKI